MNLNRAEQLEARVIKMQKRIERLESRVQELAGRLAATEGINEFGEDTNPPEPEPAIAAV